MKSSDSAQAKTRSLGGHLRTGLICVAVIAWVVWMIFPPMETLNYQKYDVQAQHELEMPFVSFPDVGPRPVIAFSADGQSAAYLANETGSADDDLTSHIQVIDVKTASPIGDPFGITDSPTPPEIVFSIDGDFLAASGASEVRVWDLRDARLVTTISLPSVRLQSRRHVAISPGGKFVATSIQEDGMDPALWVFDTETGNRLREMERTLGTANDQRFVFHPSENQLIGTGDSESGGTLLCVWDLETGKVTREMLAADNCQTLGFAYSSNLDRIAIAMYHGAREYNPFSTAIFELDTWKQVIDINNEDYVFWLAFSPDGSQISLVDASATASIWSAASGVRLQNLNLGPQGATAFASDDGALQLVKNSKNKPNVVQLLTLRASE